MSLDFAAKKANMKAMQASEELFEKGLQAMKEQNSLAALSAFERAYQAGKSPLIQSYYGVCIAMERGQIREALMLCQDALEQEPENPACYLNLGKVLIRADKKNDAILVLRKGLAAGDSIEIKQVLDQIGIRRKPVFSFLPRGHMLNRIFGLVLARLRLR